ncbi:MAG TPA: adenylate/guanylate cyclase domain-containing protein [Phycisphaerales bacterium]|nr:adenylate/guanylate cyclase domain-containing protein [Phycisphaerales bacterium]
MTWNEQRATERVNQNDFSDFEVKVADLAKEMDFANLGRKDVRRADAAHIYADVPNFHLTVRDAGADQRKQRELVRAASVLQRVQSELLKSSDIIGDHEISKIQSQATRLHALCYKPYTSEETRATHAVKTAITLNTYLYDIFNPTFAEVRNFQGSVGVDAGHCLIASPGYRGERERICLGTPANRAAKILGNGGSITITEAVHKHLPKALQEFFEGAGEKAGTKVYVAKSLRWSSCPDLAGELGVTWKPAKWEKRTAELKDALPLSEMDVAEARTIIDVDALSERNSRRTHGIALYADLDGFTSYVQGAEDDDTVVSLVRELHMIRSEFHAVLERDYPGIVLQHQGDRVFAILHDPCGTADGDEQKRCRRAVDAAIGLQSSMVQVLTKKLAGGRKLRVAVGLDVGRQIVSRLGAKGKRTAVCFGPCVTGAEHRQLDSAGGEIRISPAIYDQLDDGVVKKQFAKGGESYVAVGLTFAKIDMLEEEAAAREGRLGARVESGKVRVTTTAGTVTRPWSSSAS